MDEKISLKHSTPQTGRSGFSLLEVMIATGVLAGSAMVLISLIGMGTKYGQLAEQRVIALATADSLLEELLATGRLDPTSTEITGATSSLNPLGFRIRVAAYRPSGGNSVEAIEGLQQITVEIFASELGLGSAEPEPLCSLSRIVRLPSPNAGSQGEDSVQPINPRSGSNQPGNSSSSGRRSGNGS